MLPCVCSVNRSQRTSKCGKNISDTLGYHLVCHFFVLTTFWRHLWSITELDARQHGISQVLLTSAFILWPPCTCGLRFFGVFLCGFAVFGPPLTPPSSQVESFCIEYIVAAFKTSIYEVRVFVSRISPLLEHRAAYSFYFVCMCSTKIGRCLFNKEPSKQPLA